MPYYGEEKKVLTDDDAAVAVAEEADTTPLLPKDPTIVDNDKKLIVDTTITTTVIPTSAYNINVNIGKSTNNNDNNNDDGSDDNSLFEEMPSTVGRREMKNDGKLPFCIGTDIDIDIDANNEMSELTLTKESFEPIFAQALRKKEFIKRSSSNSRPSGSGRALVPLPPPPPRRRNMVPSSSIVRQQQQQYPPPLQRKHRPSPSLAAETSEQQLLPTLHEGMRNVETGVRVPPPAPPRNPRISPVNK
jgi:hypothetical protein